MSRVRVLKTGGPTRRRGSGSLRLQRGEGVPLQKTELKYDIPYNQKLIILLFHGNGRNRLKQSIATFNKANI